MIKEENPFSEIYKQCNNLSNIEKYEMFAKKSNKIPLYLDIELTNYCNIHCNMCPVGTGVMKRNRGFMSDEVFGKILDNIKRYHIQGVRLIRWGEPTLHTRFLDWMEALKDEGVLVHFNTNGLLLDEEMIRRIIDIKVDSVKFSFQGIDDLTYREMRSGGSYSKLLSIIKMMHAMRRDRCPYISVTTSTTYESDEEILHFKKEISPYCDEVSVGKTKIQHIDIERMKLPKNRREVYERFMKADKCGMRRMASCPEIWDKLSINWDGSVSACCQDYDNIMIVGNILEQDLKEIFHDEKERYYREVLKNNNYEQLALCQNCYEYIPLKH